MIKDSLYYSSPGLVAGSAGYSSNVLRYINQLGFWKYSRTYIKDAPSWLLCGDSVTMGIDCNGDSTFAGIINNSLDSINILNSALIGYSSIDYLNITRKFLVDDNNNLNIKRIYIFWCLNDIYSNLPDLATPGVKDDNLFSELIIYLREHSKLYQFLKNTFTDRPKAYFSFDKQFYNNNNKEFDRAVNNIKNITEITNKYKVNVYLFILPYEYQVKNFDNKEVFSPQKILAGSLNSANIKVIDCSDAFAMYKNEASRLYLYGDGIHFSDFGHRVLAAYLLRKIHTF